MWSFPPNLQAFGYTLSNPIGLAAGFDKNGEAIDAMLDMGFGLVEIGSVVPKPQPGNPRPRMFRLLPDGAAINRYGLNSQGLEEVKDRMMKRIVRFAEQWAEKQGLLSSRPRTPEDMALPLSLREKKILGANLAKNKTSPSDSNADYVEGVAALGPLADYLTVNVSCPNQAGITSLQRKGVIGSVLREVLDARDKLPRRVPVLVKIGPDSTEEELADIAAAALECGVDGAIVSNTTNQRPAGMKSGELQAMTCALWKSVQFSADFSLIISFTDHRKVQETGGLSGPPLKPLALKTLRSFYRLTNGKLPLVGCGGIASADDALEFARNGATVVQLYTGLSYYGPGLVYDIKKGVKGKLEAEGKTWKDVIGADVQL